jgi:hypothetical protein
MALARTLTFDEVRVCRRRRYGKARHAPSLIAVSVPRQMFDAWPPARRMVTAVLRGTRLALRAIVRACIIVVLASCAATGSYLGARTPPKGTETVGLVTRLSVGRNAVPFPQADLTVAYSPTDDLSVHVRAMILSFGGEGIVRWRFLQTGRWHVALAPAVALTYWPASRGDEYTSYMGLRGGANVLARLNVLASIDLGAADLDLAAFGGVARNVETAVPAADDAPYVDFHYQMQGLIAIGGGALGVTVRSPGRSFHPAIEWMRFIAREATFADAPVFRPADVWTLTLTWER